MNSLNDLHVELNKLYEEIYCLKNKLEIKEKKIEYWRKKYFKLGEECTGIMKRYKSPLR